MKARIKQTQADYRAVIQRSFAGLYEGDNLRVLRDFPENSFGSCVTDPPYGLEFMGKAFDCLGAGVERTSKSAGGYGKDAPTNVNPYAAARVRYGEGVYFSNRPAKERKRAEGKRDWTTRAFPEYVSGLPMMEFHLAWACEVYRVLKPGAYLLAFGGSRTCHWLVAALEIAGFIPRDLLCWHTGSGMPKSHDVGKATKSDKWKGFGTGLKPGSEYISLCQKPREGTYAANVLKHGVGGLNIDGTRIHRDADDKSGWAKTGADGTQGFQGESTFRIAAKSADHIAEVTSKGRWPSNVLLMHAEGCKRVGSQQVYSGPGAVAYVNKSSEGGNIAYGEENRIKGTPRITHRNPDGTEQIDVWKCDEGCPVAALDAQSGVSGGASRYFKVFEPEYGMRTEEIISICLSKIAATAGESSKQKRQKMFAALALAVTFSSQGGMQLDECLGLSTRETEKEFSRILKTVIERIRNIVQKYSSVPKPTKKSEIPNLAPSAESQMESVTMPITVSHTKSNGCVVSVILDTTQKSEGLGDRDFPEFSGFYCPKPSKRERDKGLHSSPEKRIVQYSTANNTSGVPSNWSADRNTQRRNDWPTVKPISLMRYLIRLITPPGETVLEPFSGSGTTALAAFDEGMSVVAIDNDPHAIELSQVRMEWYISQMEW